MIVQDHVIVAALRHGVGRRHRDVRAVRPATAEGDGSADTRARDPVERLAGHLAPDLGVVRAVGERANPHSLDPRPGGLILHLAGPTDEGFRIIEVWESEAAWRDHADDLGSVMIEENVVSAAGTTYRTSTDELVHLIRSLGKTPVQRDTLYREVKVF